MQLQFQIYKQPQCWLLNNHQYKEWSTQNCGLLWCHSKPGAGKTVLSSVIINDLQQKYREDPNVTVVFFYCEYDDPVKRMTSKIVASILDQLMYDPKVLTLVKETWMDKSSNLQHLGLENLQDLIIQLLQQSQHTYIIVDALDECDHPDNVASILQDLAEHASILVTSRSESEDIAAALGHHPQVHITPERLQHDIKHFVTLSLEKHRRISKRSEEIKQHISRVLVSNADGMFLWVTLMIELLANQMTDHGICSALLQLPIGLTATYFRILTKIDQLPSRLWCLRVITWILCARRPLELSELITGIAIEDMDKSAAWDVTKVPSNPYDVIFDCNGIVSCNPYSSWSHSAIHTYICSRLPLDKPLEVVSTVPAYHIFPQSKGHAMLAKLVLNISGSPTQNRIQIIRSNLFSPIIGFHSLEPFYICERLLECSH
ncbi:hypothetical protein C8F04DRAFT_499694 [Mycena alexandri]|uniref:Nephrocystin 3-like N-terminal domain-containing protein n=1 Tax=Mycena alexandri TaxID=1745969 RepID=A0AAD6SXN9_9AGAR|nr:hypothetical protein C8F04DRAFT_499694 [Mycena alexandri]